MSKKKAESWLSASLHKEFKTKTHKNRTTMAKVMRAAAIDFVKRHRKKRKPKQAA
jgi:predicted hydrolase (HD superfamily)